MSYIKPIPGNIKNADDSQTNLLEALGLIVDPLTNLGDYNKGRNDPPIATIEIDGREYPLKAVLDALKDTIAATVNIPVPVTFTYDSTGNAWSADRTVEEIADFIADGVLVTGTLTTGDYTVTMAGYLDDGLPCFETNVQGTNILMVGENDGTADSWTLTAE